MTKKSNRRAWPWFVLMAIAFIGIAASVGDAIVSSLKTITNSVTYLPLDDSICKKKSEWTSKPTLFLRDGAQLSQADTIAAITVTGPNGSPIPILYQSLMSIGIPAGKFNSIGNIGLSALNPSDEICIDVVGLDQSLQADDLMVLQYFVPSVLMTILKSGAVGIVFVVVFVISIKKALRAYSLRS